MSIDLRERSPAIRGGGSCYVPCSGGQPLWIDSPEVSIPKSRNILSWNSGTNGFDSTFETGFFGDGQVNVNNMFTIVTPLDGIVKKLVVSLRNNSDGSNYILLLNQQIIVTVYKLGTTSLPPVATSMVATLRQGDNTVSVSTGSFRVKAGDKLSVAVTRSNGLQVSPTIGITSSIEIDV